MTEFSTILYDKHADGVSVIRLNRPSRMNAYTAEMTTDLTIALRDFQRDDSARALVLTGEGRGFCSGGDLGSVTDIRLSETRMLGHTIVMREGFHEVVRAVRVIDKPMVGAINGPAVAGGLALALLCDIRVASTTAKFGDPSGAAGALPDEGGAWLFPRAVGMERAMRMTLLGEMYDAQQGLNYGFVSEVVTPGDLEHRAREIAATLAASAPLSVRLAKRMMLRAQEASLDQALADAELAVMGTNDSADSHAGNQAFFEKSAAPEFDGR